MCSFFLVLFCFPRQFSDCLPPSQEHFLSSLHAKPSLKQVVSWNPAYFSHSSLSQVCFFLLLDDGLFFMKWCYNYMTAYVYALLIQADLSFFKESLCLVALSHSFAFIGTTLVLGYNRSCHQFGLSYLPHIFCPSWFSEMSFGSSPLLF